MVNSKETVDEQDMDVDNAFEKNTSHKDSNKNISSEDDSSNDSTDDCYDKDGNEEEDEDNNNSNNNQVAQNYENNLCTTTESITLQHMAADDFQDNTYGGQHNHYDDEFQQEDADVNHVNQQKLLEGVCFQLFFSYFFHSATDPMHLAHEIDEQSPSEDEHQADTVLHAPHSCTPYDNDEDNWFEGNCQPTFNIEGEEPHGLVDNIFVSFFHSDSWQYILFRRIRIVTKYLSYKTF